MPTPEKSPRGRRAQSLDAAVKAFSRKKIKSLDRDKVLTALRKEGIDSLETLVGAAIGSVAALDPEDLICYPYYVYRRFNPLFEEELGQDLKEFDRFAQQQFGG
ncbi:MAG TPA: hypothetical protein VIC28_01025 [Thermoanaerobaculia bacterium]|jgi:hypothetical protein